MIRLFFCGKERKDGVRKTKTAYFKWSEKRNECGKTMTLNAGEVNATYIVEKLDLPLQMEKRLQALGMTYGTKVEVLNNKSGGTLIIKVRGTRFAIGKGISKNIEVRRSWYGA